MNNQYLLKNKDLKKNEKLNEILNSINKNNSLHNMRVLEVGIGTGIHTINYIENKFKSYYALEPQIDIYNVLINLIKKHNSNIKPYNMNLEEFTHNIEKKFDMIILKNVVHFIGYFNLIEYCKKIVKKNSIILIQNPKAKPRKWGNQEFLKTSVNFNLEKWLKFQNKLNNCYNDISNSDYLHEIIIDDDNDVFFILKTNNGFE